MSFFFSTSDIAWDFQGIEITFKRSILDPTPCQILRARTIDQQGTCFGFAGVTNDTIHYLNSGWINSSISQKAVVRFISCGSCTGSVK